MRAYVHAVCAAMVLVLTASLATVRADEEKEEKVALDKLPEKVTAAVKAKFPGAELVSASKEMEDKEIVFEVSIKYKGQNIEVTVKPDGTITEVEKEIAAKDLPAAVTKALEAKYPKATIKKAEEVTKGEKVVFEVLLVTAENKTFEAIFAPDGKFVSEESKDKKKEEKKKEDK